jgi:hypothetical protein
MRKTDASIEIDDKGRHYFSYFIGDAFVIETPFESRMMRELFGQGYTYRVSGSQSIIVNSKLPRRERSAFILENLRNPPTRELDVAGLRAMKFGEVENA